MHAYNLLVIASAILKYRAGGGERGRRGEGKEVRVAIPELTKRLQNATVLNPLARNN